MPSNIKLTTNEFDSLRKIIHDICGIAIADNKAYLVEMRLEPILHEHNCSSFMDLCHLLQKGASSDLQDKLIVAITTNETSFFRDEHPFETLKSHLLPTLTSAPSQTTLLPHANRQTKIWCASASTGQEPYSVGITIDEFVKQNPSKKLSFKDFSIFVTDISPKVLNKSRKGVYYAYEIARGLSKERLEKHFTETNNLWTVDASFKAMMDFQRLNLMDPFHRLGPFDLIFCRNVLIYFDLETKTKIIDKFYDRLNVGGTLVLGGSENLYGIETKFKSSRFGQTILYQKH